MSREHVVVAVTPLPSGWVNIYVDKEDELFTPCPAMLLRERRFELGMYNDPPKFTETLTPLDPPYETDVVFADVDEGGYIEAAAELGSNYSKTIFRPSMFLSGVDER